MLSDFLIDELNTDHVIWLCCKIMEVCGLILEENIQIVYTSFSIWYPDVQSSAKLLIKILSIRNEEDCAFLRIVLLEHE